MNAGGRHQIHREAVIAAVLLAVLLLLLVFVLAFCGNPSPVPPPGQHPTPVATERPATSSPSARPRPETSSPLAPAPSGGPGKG